MKGNMQKTVNHIALILDRSGSTQGISNEIIAQFNEQADFINKKSKQSNQKTFLSLYTFSTKVDRLLLEVPLDFVTLNKVSTKDYEIEGMTSLLDSVGTVIEDLSQLNKNVNSSKENHSFLIIVLTDGEENSSVLYNKNTLKALMSSKVKTDMWSFVFLCPVGSKKNLVSSFSIPEGNVQEWETDSKGLYSAGKATLSGLDNYFVSRSTGKKSTSSFFTDLKGITLNKIKKELVEVTSDFEVRNVTRAGSCLPIREFCETVNGFYVNGSAFYQLTKPETIQPSKQIVVQNVYSGKLYTGESARELLNLPNTVGNIKVRPGDHQNFKVFVQSTSVNRKLVEGTTLLIKVQKNRSTSTNTGRSKSRSGKTCLCINDAACCSMHDPIGARD